MAFTNKENKELNCKILYAGSPQSGKTENLQSLLRTLKPESKLDSSVVTNFEEYGFWEFLPLSIGTHNGYQVRMHLYTLNLNLPLQTVYHSLLDNVDGIVYVVDRSPNKIVESFDYLEKTISLLHTHGIMFESLPAIFQYNKSDLKEKTSANLLKKYFNCFDKQEIEASAVNDQNILESLLTLVKTLPSG